LKSSEKHETSNGGAVNVLSTLTGRMEYDIEHFPSIRRHPPKFEIKDDFEHVPSENPTENIEEKQSSWFVWW